MLVAFSRPISVTPPFSMTPGFFYPVPKDLPMCCTYPSIDPKYNRHEGMQVTCDKDLRCMQQFVATKQTCALPRHLNALGALGPWMTLTIYDLVAKLLYKMQPKVCSSKDRRPKRGTDDNIWDNIQWNYPKKTWNRWNHRSLWIIPMACSFFVCLGCCLMQGITFDKEMCGDLSMLWGA